MRARLKVFFDGGCRGDPGRMEVAVVAAGKTTILRDLGYGTSTDAEWLALIHALTIAQSLGPKDFILVGDSADVVAKANGALKCRGDALQHLGRFHALAAATGQPRVRHVRRSHNLAASRWPQSISDDVDPVQQALWRALLVHRQGGLAARPTLSDYVDVQGVYPAGRLDLDSEGLLLLTDDGALQAQIAGPSYKLPKIYLVQVEGEVAEAILLQRGETSIRSKMCRP